MMAQAIGTGWSEEIEQDYKKRHKQKNAFANKRENRYTKRIERRWKGVDEMTEKEMKSIKMSTLYELRLLFTQGEKTNYTKEEIVELLDKIASAKEQEQKDKHKIKGLNFHPNYSTIVS